MSAKELDPVIVIAVEDEHGKFFVGSTKTYIPWWLRYKGTIVPPANEVLKEDTKVKRGEYDSSTHETQAAVIIPQDLLDDTDYRVRASTAISFGNQSFCLDHQQRSSHDSSPYASSVATLSRRQSSSMEEKSFFDLNNSEIKNHTKYPAEKSLDWSSAPKSDEKGDPIFDFFNSPSIRYSSMLNGHGTPLANCYEKPQERQDKSNYTLSSSGLHMIDLVNYRDCDSKVHQKTTVESRNSPANINNSYSPVRRLIPCISPITRPTIARDQITTVRKGRNFNHLNSIQQIQAQTTKQLLSTYDKEFVNRKCSTKNISSEYDSVDAFFDTSSLLISPVQGRRNTYITTEISTTPKSCNTLQDQQTNLHESSNLAVSSCQSVTDLTSSMESNLRVPSAVENTSVDNKLPSITDYKLLQKYIDSVVEYNESVSKRNEDAKVLEELFSNAVYKTAIEALTKKRSMGINDVCN